MITTKDAIAVGRSLLGTPYSELDCINFIKKIIRTAPGGDPKYTTAGTATLWASINKSGKYQDLVMQQFSLDDPIPGMLAFKGEPLGRDGQPHHVGLVTERGTVLHSSSVKGEVIESPLTAKDNWSLLAIHKLIATDIISLTEEEEEIPVFLYSATPNELVNDGSWLNLRAKPSVTSTRLAKIPKGAYVDVLEETNDKWVKVDYNGTEGYCYRKYLSKNEPLSDTEDSGISFSIDPGDAIRIFIEDESGYVFSPIGAITVTIRNSVD